MILHTGDKYRVTSEIEFGYVSSVDPDIWVESLMGKFNDDTNFLFADPSFLSGLATALDLGGTLVEFNQSPNGQFADARALASDWAVTGKDIMGAYSQCDETEEEKA